MTSLSTPEAAVLAAARVGERRTSGVCDAMARCLLVVDRVCNDCGERVGWLVVVVEVVVGGVSLGT